MKLYCCFIDNTPQRRNTFLHIKEEMNAKQKDYQISCELGSTMDKGYTVKSIREQLLATQRGQHPYFWILDVQMADYAEIAIGLNNDPDLTAYHLPNLANSDADINYLLFRYLKNFLQKNKTLGFYISSNDEEYLRKEGLLREDEYLLDFPQAKKTTGFDLRYQEDVQRTANELIASCKRAFKLNGGKVGGVWNSAQAMLSHIFDHKEQNHLEDYKEWPILDEVAKYLYYRDWQQLAQQLNMFESIRSRPQPRDFLAETIKGLSDSKLTMSGLLLLLWGVLRDHQLNTQLAQSDTFCKQIEYFFREQTKLWHAESTPKPYLDALETFARYGSFFVFQSSEQQFMRCNAKLVEFLSKLLQPNGGSAGTGIQLKELNIRVQQAELELVLFNVDPKLIASLNSSSERLLGKSLKEGSMASKFLNWNLGRKIGYAAATETKRKKPETNSGLWHDNFSKTNFGAHGSVRFEYDKTNKYTHLIFRL